MKIDFHKVRLSMFVAIVVCSLVQIQYICLNLFPILQYLIAYNDILRTKKFELVGLRKKLDTIGCQMADSKTKVAHIGFKPKTIPSLSFYKNF